MNARPFFLIVKLGLTLFFLAGLLYACYPPTTPSPTTDLQSQVNTAVVGTIVNYMVETKVVELAQATANQVVFQAATATPAPTSTPLPSPTPLPTQVASPTTPPPQPTAAPTSASTPVISASANTNCRAGPNIHYRVVGYLVEGDTSTVHGRDSGGYWWYIQHPTKPDQYCWVWSETTQVTGDLNSIPVVTASEQEDMISDWYDEEDYYIYGYDGLSCTPVKHGGKVYCYPYYNSCKPYKYWNCNAWGYCGCKPNCYTSCKKYSPCPPLTCVNYRTYCNKYPRCCE